jgi:hypothetical protein
MTAFLTKSLAGTASYCLYEKNFVVLPSDEAKGCHRPGANIFGPAA